MRAPLQCRAPHLHVLLLLILYFVAKSAAAPGDVLFRHDFRGSTYGWTAQSDYNAAVVTKFGLGMMGNGIEGSDTSSAPWFFQAPMEALGDRSAAYDGLLRVTYGHRAFSANGQAPLDRSSPTLGYDLHLISPTPPGSSPSLATRGRGGLPVFISAVVAVGELVLPTPELACLDDVT